MLQTLARKVVELVLGKNAKIAELERALAQAMADKAADADAIKAQSDRAAAAEAAVADLKGQLDSFNEAEAAEDADEAAAAELLDSLFKTPEA